VFCLPAPRGYIISSFLHDTFSLTIGHTSLVDVVLLPLSVCSVLRMIFALYSIFCEFCVRGPGLRSLSPLRLVEAKPECIWITVQPTRRPYPTGPNRAVVGSLAVRVLLTFSKRWHPALIMSISEYLGARTSRLRRGVCTCPPPADSPSPSSHWPRKTTA